MGENVNLNILKAMQASGENFNSSGVSINKDALMRLDYEPNIYSEEADSYYYGLGASAINGGPIQDPLFNFNSNLSKIGYQGQDYNHGFMLSSVQTGTRPMSSGGSFINTVQTGSVANVNGSFINTVQTGTVVQGDAAATEKSKTDSDASKKTQTASDKKTDSNNKTSSSKTQASSNKQKTNSATKQSASGTQKSDKQQSTQKSTQQSGTQYNTIQGQNKSGTVHYAVKYDGPNGRPTVSFTDNNGNPLTSVDARRRDVNLYNEAQTKRKDAAKAFDKDKGK